MSIEFRGVHAEFLADTTLERDLEGSLSCGKTTVALWAELEAYKAHPGIWGLLARWTGEATRTLLQPAFEQLARIHGTTWEWNKDENAYELSNGSRVFSFGLKTQSQDPSERYGKIRGLPVSRIYIDQAEQVPADIASELRFRLRPDIEARQRGHAYPRQLTFTPNPVNTDHWLAKQFPIDNKIKGRRYWSLSLYDNAHNLPGEFIEQMEREYPPEHPKHQTVILGQRGLNVIGDPIFDATFDRRLHVRPVSWLKDADLLEGYQLGKHNPTWLVAQRSPSGVLQFLGGIMGKGLMLADFLPMVKEKRGAWFPLIAAERQRVCIAPMGERHSNTDARYTLLSLLRKEKVQPQWRDDANAPDVRLATIETLAGLLRRRTSQREESIAVNQDADRWWIATRDGMRPSPFLAFAFEGGYTWSDHFISVSHKELRQPNEDDEYANAMHCVENIILNFCAGLESESQSNARIAAARRHGGFSSPMPSGDAGWMAY